MPTDVNHSQVARSSVGRARPASIDILPKAVLQVLFKEEFDRLYKSELTEGWKSLEQSVIRYAHTCRNWRRFFIPLIYGRLTIHRLSTLKYLAEIFKCDPQRKIAKSITYLHWDWNPCGMYSSIWGLAGALCNRAELMEKVNQGLYSGVPSLNLFGEIAPTVQTLPTAWPYLSSRFAPSTTFRENQGPDGDPKFKVADPLEVLQLLFSIVQYLDSVDEIKWNAAAIPIPPHLFRILPHPSKLKKLHLYNEHNLGDPLMSAYAHFPSSIEELSLCFHDSPDIQTPNFSEARCDAQRQYYNDHDIFRGSGVESSEILHQSVRKCLQWWDDSYTPPVMWPPLGKVDETTDGGSHPPDNSRERKGKASTVNTSSASAISRAQSSSSSQEARSDAQPSNPVLPWPWTTAQEPADLSRKFSHFGHRTLARRIRELIECGSLKQLNVCQCCFLHNRVFHSGVALPRRASDPSAAGFSSNPPNSSSQQKSNNSGARTQLSFFEDPLNAHLWLRVNLSLCYCNSDVGRIAEYPLSSFSNPRPVSSGLGHDVPPIFLGSPASFVNSPWTSACRFAVVFRKMLWDYITLRHEMGEIFKICVGQPLRITPHDIEFAIEHFGWVKIGDEAAIVESQPLQDILLLSENFGSVDLHRQVMEGRRSDVLARLGSLQIPL
ncbi:unnamed protein product [Sympodiomycopsis kandeliae]